MITLIKKIVTRLVPEEKKWELKNKYSIPSMEWSLSNLKKNGFLPQQILDVGAYEGQWTIMVKTIFPQANVLMLEAQQSKAEELSAVCQHFQSSVQLHMGLVGPENNREAVFYENETVSSALPEHHTTTAKQVVVPMYTLDTILETNNFPLPNFIKLDVQGYELEVLNGAANSLKMAEVVLMEVSLIDINKGAPLFHEVIDYMYQKGFLTYDICSLVRRPLDRALWQTDLLFVKKSSPLMSSKKWN